MNWLIEEDTTGAVVVKMSSNKLNLMNEGFFEDLNHAFDVVEKDYPDRPVVLTSIGSVFSAGLDLNNCYTLFSKGDLEDIRIWFEQFRDSMIRVFSFRQPLIGVVNGHAIAGGLVLALCCDLRIGVSSNAKFGLNEVKVGFPLPHSLAEIIKHSVGTQTAEELIFRSSIFGPEDAYNYGLFHDLTDHTNLMETALGHVREYGELFDINSYSFAKKALRAEVMESINRFSPELEKDIPHVLASEETVRNIEKVIEDMRNK